MCCSSVCIPWSNLYFNRIAVPTSLQRGGLGKPSETSPLLAWSSDGVLFSPESCRLPAIRKDTCLRRLFPSSMIYWQRFSLTGTSHLTFTLMKHSSDLWSASCSWSCVTRTFRTRSVCHRNQHCHRLASSLESTGWWCSVNFAYLTFPIILFVESVTKKGKSI